MVLLTRNILEWIAGRDRDDLADASLARRIEDGHGDALSVAPEGLKEMLSLISPLLVAISKELERLKKGAIGNWRSR